MAGFGWELDEIIGDSALDAHGSNDGIIVVQLLISKVLLIIEKMLVEELTLYMIQLKKEMKNKTNTIKILEQKILQMK